MLTFKKKKETISEHAHTEVYSNDNYLGYIIRENSLYSAKDVNWVFVSKVDDLKYMYTKTKGEIIETLKERF